MRREINQEYSFFFLLICSLGHLMHPGQETGLSREWRARAVQERAAQHGALLRQGFETGLLRLQLAATICPEAFILEKKTNNGKVIKT